MGGSRLRKGSVRRLPRQRLCHSERSEESQRLHWPEILRFAQDDNPGGGELQSVIEWHGIVIRTGKRHRCLKNPQTSPHSIIDPQLFTMTLM